VASEFTEDAADGRALHLARVVEGQAQAVTRGKGSKRGQQRRARDRKPAPAIDIRWILIACWNLARLIGSGSGTSRRAARNRSTARCARTALSQPASELRPWK